MYGGSGWAIALAAVALWMLAAVGPAVAAGGATVTTVPGAPLFGELVPGTDGLLWHAERTEDSYGTRIVRVGPDGVTATTVPGHSPSRRAEPQMLPDGSMGLVVDRLDETGGGIGVEGLALMRFVPASGVVESIRRLRHAVDDTTALAVAPDGAVWFAKSCKDRLGHIALNGRVSYLRLSATHCAPGMTHVQGDAALAFDPKGALWFADFCTGRIARVSLAGRVRQWRELRAGCDGSDVNGILLADPRGGIAYAARGSERDVSGRVHNGRYERFASYGDGVFTPDGALWRVLSGGIERRDVDGTITIRGTGRVRPVSNLAPARDGGVATVLATYWRSDPNYDSHNTFPRPDAYLDGRVVVLRPDGRETSWALPDSGTDVPTQLSSAYLAFAPDGASYVRETRVAGSDFSTSTRLLRVLPDALVPPRPPIARVSTVLGRVGRVAWLQASCDAELARFCLGTVRLKGKDVPNPARFGLAGQFRGAVPVALGQRALRVLRQRGKLRMVAEVRTDDGVVTRSRVTIGSNAPR